MFSWPANYDFCYTLAGVISREGVGLHSGEKTRVTISPYEKKVIMFLSGISLARFLSLLKI